jgi:hypothetical protein
MEGKPTFDQNHPDSQKNPWPFLIGWGITWILLGYFLLKYFVWYFDKYIGPAWL